VILARLEKFPEILPQPAPQPPYEEVEGKSNDMAGQGQELKESELGQG